MPILRCTAKLLKRLRQPPKLPEPTPDNNPLGEWYADLDVWRREPFLVMLNAATGAMLVLSGRAEKLKRLNELSALQMSLLLESFGIRGPMADAELTAMDAGYTFAATRDRSLLASLNHRKGSECSFQDGLSPASGRGAGEVVARSGGNRPGDPARGPLIVPSRAGQGFA